MRKLDMLNGCVFAANSPFGKQMTTTLFEKGCNIAMIDDKKSMEELEKLSKQLNAGHNREGYDLPKLEHFVYPIELNPSDKFHNWHQAVFQASTCFIDADKLHFLIIWDCNDEKQQKLEEWLLFLDLIVPYLVTSDSPKSKCNHKLYPINMTEAFVIHITNSNNDSPKLFKKYLQPLQKEGVGYCNVILPEKFAPEDWSNITRMIASILQHDIHAYPSRVEYQIEKEDATS